VVIAVGFDNSSPGSQPLSPDNVTVAASVVVNVNVGVLLEPGDDGEMETYDKVGGAVSMTIAF
jgi:hypothetical protein